MAAAALRQLALNLNPAYERMVQIRPQLLLDVPCPVHKRAAGRLIDGKQRKRGEIAYDVANLRMKRKPVELG